MRLQWVTRGYKRLQGITRGYRGLQRVTGGYKGLQEVTEGYKGLQEVTGGVSARNVFRYLYSIFIYAAFLVIFVFAPLVLLFG